VKREVCGGELLLLGAQGLWTMLLWSALNSCGLYARAERGADEDEEDDSLAPPRVARAKVCSIFTPSVPCLSV